jgi:hypothetical protein
MHLEPHGNKKAQVPYLLLPLLLLLLLLHSPCAFSVPHAGASPPLTTAVPEAFVSA